MNPSATKTRLLFLDFFRGLTVASMILVNNPGDWGHIYAPLEHSKWNGCTPTDLVFPFFLFIMGVTLNYSIGDKKGIPSLHKGIVLNAARRSVILFGLAIFLSLLPDFDFSTLRIMGVLQRISIVFFISAVLFIKTTEKVRIGIIIATLILYWFLMTRIPVPGIGPSNLEPGRNLAAWLDTKLLTPKHMWSGTKTWDPEGILSTLPAVSTCLFGILAGGFLKRKDQAEAGKVAWLFCIALLAVGGGLIWNVFFPMNKALWTSSFVLFTGGLATAILSLSYWIIEVQQFRRFTVFFEAFGANAISAYVVSGLIPFILGRISLHTPEGKQPLTEYLYQSVFASWLSPYNASLASAVFYVIILSIPLRWMYKRKIFIKI